MSGKASSGQPPSWAPRPARPECCPRHRLSAQGSRRSAPALRRSAPRSRDSGNACPLRSPSRRHPVRPAAPGPCRGSRRVVRRPSARTRCTSVPMMSSASYSLLRNQARPRCAQISPAALELQHQIRRRRIAVGFVGRVDTVAERGRQAPVECNTDVLRPDTLEQVTEESCKAVNACTELPSASRMSGGME